MQVIIKKRGRPVESKKMSPSERADSLSKVKELEEQIRDPESSHMLQIKPVLLENQKIIKEKLDMDSELAAKGKEKDRLVKEREVYEKKIKEEIDPIVQKFIKPGHPDYVKALDASWRATEPEVTNLIHKYRDIDLRIEPDDPNSGSLNKALSA